MEHVERYIYTSKRDVRIKRASMHMPNTLSVDKHIARFVLFSIKLGKHRGTAFKRYIIFMRRSASQYRNDRLHTSSITLQKKKTPPERRLGQQVTARPASL